MYTSYILSNSSIEEKDSLTHHGVKGMKWGRRKERKSSSSGRLRKKASDVKKTISKKLANINKEKVKKVAKTSAVIAGGVALTATLGYVGLITAEQIYRNGAKTGAAYQNMMDRLYGDYNGPVQDYTGLWIRNKKSSNKLTYK